MPAQSRSLVTAMRGRERASVPVDWPRTWFRLEAKHAPGQAPPTAQVLGILKLDMPTHSNLRQLTAYTLNIDLSGRTT